MDGLTISTADSLLESGKTISELRKDRIQREQDFAEVFGRIGKVLCRYLERRRSIR